MDVIIFEIGKDVWIITDKYIYCNDLVSGRCWSVTIDQFLEIIRKGH
jgi:hypothetical protein